VNQSKHLKGDSIVTCARASCSSRSRSERAAAAWYSATDENEGMLDFKNRG